MFLQRRICTSTGSYSDNIDKLKYIIKNSDAVIIGAGAGLSTSAGLIYTGERFQKYFSDFAEKYGFSDMYSGGFYQYSTPEEHWAYWSRYIFVNRYMDAPKPVYEELFELVKDKDYFAITTNVDHCFQKAGFDNKRLFYTQGDYGLFQCSEPCCQETFDNEDIILQMVEKQKDMCIPPKLLPVCPHCGKPMTMNLRSDNNFVEDEGWHKASERYSEFLRRHRNMRVLFLELGVGMNTPIIIKYPFWQMAAENKNAFYVCVNYGESFCPSDIEERSICLNSDIGKVIEDIL